MKTKTTSVQGGHLHRYIVDGNGNGRTSRVCHPNNPTICHSHNIVNYEVQHAASECYPNCTGVGAPGLGEHIHIIDLGKQVIENNNRRLNATPQHRVYPGPTRMNLGRQTVSRRRRLVTAPTTTTQGSFSINYGNNTPGANVFNSEMNRAKRALDGEMAGPESSGNTGVPGGSAGPGVSGGSGGSGGNTGGSGGGNYGGGY